MDPAKRRVQKEQLLRDTQANDASEPRRFKDIVRNAADIDPKLLSGIMKAFNVSREAVRAWGAGTDVPADFERYVIVDKIRELLEEQLDA